ncbi:hypothetical protein TEK04_20030 [Klenkia sp. LSe6-5]|uniref:Uncharacterized protein n=1 Tax=Klenkia sesuvii TaxID=3103137 RepID=A0ABU8DZD4_9ACTN
MTAGDRLSTGRDWLVVDPDRPDDVRAPRALLDADVRLHGRPAAPEVEDVFHADPHADPALAGVRDHLPDLLRAHSAAAVQPSAEVVDRMTREAVAAVRSARQDKDPGGAP